MAPAWAPNTPAIAGMIGSTPMASATGMMIDTTIPTLAVLLVVSEISNAMTMAISASTQELCTPVASAMAVPKVSAKPVARVCDQPHGD